MNDQATQLRRAMQMFRPHYENGGTAVQAVHEPLPPSRATGSVSYGPAPQRVRQRRVRPPAAARFSLAKAIAVASGKGGVGKSNLAVNLAVAMSRMKLKVCLLDADMGLANTDVLCNVAPKLTLEHVVQGKCKLWEAMLLAPGGFRLIPGASGVANMADLTEAERRGALQQLAMLERVADVLIVDTGAGIGPSVLSFASAANTVIVLTTPEPTAITDAYATIKTLCARSPETQIELIVNMAASEKEGQAVFSRVDRVCRTFLNRTLTFGGSVPSDPAVPAAVRQRVPFVLHAPESDAANAVWSIAQRLSGNEPLIDADQDTNNRVAGGHFFAKLANWFRGGNPTQENGR